jgi:hypothetical protein
MYAKGMTTTGDSYLKAIYVAFAELISRMIRWYSINC